MHRLALIYESKKFTDQEDVRKVDIRHFDFARTLEFLFEEKWESKDHADDQGAEERLEGRPGWVDGPTGDQVLQGVSGCAASVPVESESTL
jgi:hypothetical protein